MRLVSVAEMKELESQANDAGISYERMMENAGKGLADVVHSHCRERGFQSVLGLVGRGNNGGDTLIALMHLKKMGWTVRAYTAKQRTKNDPLLIDYLKTNGEYLDIEDDPAFGKLRNWLKKTDVILDGITGTGFSLPLSGKIPKLLATISSTKNKPFTIAVDCPSGVDCDRGETAKECLAADVTVCMEAVKTGLLKFPAFLLTGKLEVVDIGLPKSLPALKKIKGEVLTSKKAMASLPKRPRDGHKGSFGTCMITAGSINYCGAVLLAAEAAYKVGAGLVRSAIPGAIYEAIAGHLPESTWLLLPNDDGVINADAAGVILRNLGRTTALLIGPGLGTEIPTKEFIKQLINKSPINTKENALGFMIDRRLQQSSEKSGLPPMVIDADGLRLLALIREWPQLLPKPAVLTPHPGEMAAMTGLSIEEIQKERIDIAREYSKKWGHVVVLKGALTVIANPDGRFVVNPVASSALATAGSGDVLAGMIIGFIAQGIAGFEAAETAVWLHAQAGLLAAEQSGSSASVSARNILAAIPNTLKTATGINY